MTTTTREWIPACERLPDRRARVLVFCRNDDAAPGEDRTWSGTTVWEPGAPIPWPYIIPRWHGRVTHWRYLPDDPAD